ncbi:MAG: Holliday junction branch migration protein RuvA [Akkermansiaceae bacterium]
MIARIKGNVLEALPGRLVVDVNGVGYMLTVSLATYDAINPMEGTPVDLRTHLHIRETAHTLYGFATEAERALFLLLIERVTGIGPAIGMAVLSGMPVEHFKSCVVNGDAAALSQIKGLGKKTAERIILELKDKVGVTDAWEAAKGESTPSASIDAESALIGLGYKQAEARKAVTAVAKLKPSAPTEDLLRDALRMLNS